MRSNLWAGSDGGFRGRAGQKEKDRERVGYGIAPEQAPGLAPEPVQPFEPCPLHPLRRPAIGSGSEIETAAAGHDPARLEAVAVAFAELVFEGDTQTHPQHIGAAPVDLFADG